METGSLIKSWLNLHWGKITDESVGAVWSDEETATFPKLIQKTYCSKEQSLTSLMNMFVCISILMTLCHLSTEGGMPAKTHFCADSMFVY